MLKITYLVMVYNEIKTVKKAIEDVININYKNKEILVIDNGSVDGSQDVIRSFKNIKKILRKKNLGVGKTIEEGISKAKGDYIFTQFSDLEYDHKRSIYMMQYAIKKKLDVVFGSRLKKKTSLISEIKKRPAILATIICTFFINKFYKKKFTDIIGVKLYKKDSIKKIPINCYKAGFEFESVSRMCKRNLRIKEVFVKYSPRKNSKDKKIKFYHMFDAIYQIFKVKIFG